MARKYLLSTGLSTSKVEEYVLDLFQMYLCINPGDIPHRSDIGFNFTITDVMKDGLESEIMYRVRSLVENIKSKMSGMIIEIESVVLIDETRVKVILSVENKIAGEYYVDIN